MDVLFEQLELLKRQISQAHRTAIAGQLSRRGLGEVNHPLLLHLLHSMQQGAPCRSQNELAQALHISPAAVANSLKSLEKSGYIRREREDADARRNRVSLSEKGQRAVEGCRQSFELVSVQMLSGFSEAEKAQLLSFRRRILQNLQDLDR